MVPVLLSTWYIQFNDAPFIFGHLTPWEPLALGTLELMEAHDISAHLTRHCQRSLMEQCLAPVYQPYHNGTSIKATILH